MKSIAVNANRVRRALARSLVCLSLFALISCGGEEAPPPPPEPAPPQPAETAPASPPPASQGASSAPVTYEREVPWIEGGEVVGSSEPDVSGEGMSSTVFEFSEAPDKVLERYRAALQAAGWQLESLGTDVVIGHKGNTMLTAMANYGGGKTRLEVFTSLKPESE